MIILFIVIADEMYVLSTSNKRVSVQLLGKNKIDDKLSRLEELTTASLSNMGVSFPGIPGHINTTVPSKIDFMPLPLPLLISRQRKHQTSSELLLLTKVYFLVLLLLF